MITSPTGSPLRWCANADFSPRLKERVMEIRKAKLEKPWPPSDRQVGVILVAHSMG